MLNTQHGEIMPFNNLKTVPETSLNPTFRRLNSSNVANDRFVKSVALIVRLVDSGHIVHDVLLSRAAVWRIMAAPLVVRMTERHALKIASNPGALEAMIEFIKVLSS